MMQLEIPRCSRIEEGCEHRKKYSKKSHDKETIRNDSKNEQIILF